MQENFSGHSGVRQAITIILTVLGILLFIYGSSKAASQSDDKEYVEGKQRQQLGAPAFGVLQADINVPGSFAAPAAILGQAQPNTLSHGQEAIENTKDDNENERDKPDLSAHVNTVERSKQPTKRPAKHH